MNDIEKQIESERFASALLAWKDLCNVVEYHGGNCIKHVKDAITVEVLSKCEPVKFESLEEMKPVFLHEYERQLRDRGL